ncbi:hypothetical protein Q3G72_013879 [Acer saccharum]|nr:hypothetical protein Q3G72_013879 [Acer saccharum]
MQRNLGRTGTSARIDPHSMPRMLLITPSPFSRCNSPRWVVNLYVIDPYCHLSECPNHHPLLPNHRSVGKAIESSIFLLENRPSPRKLL